METAAGVSAMQNQVRQPLRVAGGVSDGDRARLGDNFTMDTATLYADTDALAIPNFGPYQVIGGLANDVYKKLLVSGTFITRPYPDGDPANKRPSGITLTALTFTPPDGQRDGQVVATLQLSPDYDL